jgi:DNA (cytosine-5)-methyltransferase 1
MPQATVKEAKKKPASKCKKGPRLFSFFSGAGFLDLGFESQSFVIDYVNEISQEFLRAYRYSRQRMKMDLPEHGTSDSDVTEYLSGTQKNRLKGLVASSRKAAGLVGFIAGPPCPDFSVGGKNRGEKGQNGKLTQTYVSLICDQKPDFFLFENVKGLWQTKRHRDYFEGVKSQTHESGYITTERLINAIEYGAPQDRDRIILFGFKRSLLTDLGIKLERNSRELPDGVFPWNKYAQFSRDEAFSIPWPTTNG